MTAGEPAFAQRAAENAVNSAEDAFGTSIGSETVGLYSPSSARGFNPQLAGNIRIDGLYFDQQAQAQGRIYADTTMRIGLSAQSYPFPAPTGIADTRLRRPGDRVTGSATFTYGTYDSLQLDAEVATPIIPGRLGGFATVSLSRLDLDYASIYKQVVFGGILHWTPSDTVDVLVFDQGQDGGGALQPLIFTADGSEPPEYDRRTYVSQRWTKRHRQVNQFGVIASARMFDDWLLRAGLFRSFNALPSDYILFYRNVQPNGLGTLDAVRNAPGRDLSYSGEVRLSRTFTENKRQHILHLAVRGRDVEHVFGGGSSVSLGPVRLGIDNALPEPTFPPPAPSGLNEVSQITPGISYVGRWLDVGELSLGVQKSFFNGEATLPGAATARTKSEPWLYNSTLAVYLGPNAALYGSYTRGLEESGIAPENAANRGDVLPVSLTEQIDAGVRYKLGAGLTLIAGVFEVKKPYFDRNAGNLFTDVGNLTHRGVELSLSGRLAPGLNVVAGAMLLRARVEANAAAASFIAPVPAGRPNRNVRLNVQYGPASWNGFSIDGQVSQDGPAYANRANTVRLDANTTLDLGARYVFTVFGTSASLRLRVQNVTNVYGWTVASSGWYAPIPPRRFTAQVIADF